MGRELAETEPVVARTLAEADDALGFSLTRILWEGPEDRLAHTPITQPAVLALSVALWRLFQTRFPSVSPVVGAGHSLGEYAALVAAEVLSFPEAIRVVHARGEAMQEAVPVGEGSMAALFGLDPERVHALCDEVTRDLRDGRVLEVASLNCPGQAVVAGHVAAVEEAVRRAKALGGPEPRFLQVSAPFHTSLLEPARVRMDAVLSGVSFHRPRFPILQNVDAELHTDPEQVRANLVSQVVRPVLWEATMRRLLAMDIALYLELGPGRTLASLLKRVHRKAEILCLERTSVWETLGSLSWT